MRLSRNSTLLVQRGVFCFALLGLAACASPAEIAARQTQFNEKPIEDVIAIIGKPSQRDDRQAVWEYRETHSNRVPIQHYMNGQWVTTGYRTDEVSANCTYTATLEGGRVKVGTYQGNRCNRFAPRI